MNQITDFPILDSILDTDAYKIFMQQAVFHQYPDIDVKAEFKCRGTEDLNFLIPQLKKQIRFVGDLALTNEEFTYLASLPYFETDYLNYLKNFRYNPDLVTVSNTDNHLSISIEGSWLDVILWEIPILSLVCELYQRTKHPDTENMRKKAISHLQEKLEHIDYKNNQDLNGFTVVDFGTRRRFSKQIQEDVLHYLQKNCPFFVGTSNFHYARVMNLKPVGTQAHEWFQAHQQIAENLGNFQKLALNSWLKEYPDQLGIALTDCINMDAFLADFDKSLAEQFTGVRHDSGDPLLWGEKAIKHYKSLGIDPKTKVLVFSDGLSLDKAVSIYRYFKGKTNTSYGIGTSLTCDIPGVTALNVVLKLTECKGKPVAKISDAPGKTLSQDIDFINKLKAQFTVA